MTISGRITRKKSLGKKLHFLTIQTESKTIELLVEVEKIILQSFPSVISVVAVEDIESGSIKINKNGLEMYRFVRLSSGPAFAGADFANPAFNTLCRSMVRGICMPGTHFRRHCPFRHEFVDEAERNCHLEMLQKSLEKSTKQKLMNVDPDDIHHEKNPKCSSDRLFVEWLFSWMSKEELLCGSGVIDVAGGRGIISYLLNCLHGVTCTLVDPRGPIRLRHSQRKYLRRSGKPMFNHLCDYFGHDFYQEYKELLDNCSLIVGMHPDQATELIVDYCLENGKPFAVVPCCVFAAINPHRKLSNGEPVQTFEQFIEYLKAKDARIRKEFLKCEGRNVILYCK